MEEGKTPNAQRPTLNAQWKRAGSYDACSFRGSSVGEAAERGKTSNAQRPTVRAGLANAQWKRAGTEAVFFSASNRGKAIKQGKTSNAQRPTLNVQWKKARTHAPFLSAVRMLAKKILVSSSASPNAGAIFCSGKNLARRTKRSQRRVSFSSLRQTRSL